MDYASTLCAIFFTLSGFHKYRLGGNRDELAVMRRRAMFSHFHSTIARASQCVEESKFSCLFHVISSDGLSIKCRRDGCPNSSVEDFLHLHQRMFLVGGDGLGVQASGGSSAGYVSKTFRLASLPIHMPRDSRAKTIYSVLLSWLLWVPGVRSTIWDSTRLHTALSEISFRWRVLLQDACPTNESFVRAFRRQLAVYFETLRLSGYETGFAFHEAAVVVRCLQHILCVSRNRALVSGDRSFWSSMVRFTNLFANGRMRQRLLSLIFSLAERRVKLMLVVSLSSEMLVARAEVLKFLRRYDTGLTLQKMNLIASVFQGGASPYCWRLCVEGLTPEMQLLSFRQDLYLSVRYLFDQRLDTPLLARWKAVKPTQDYLMRGTYIHNLLLDSLGLCCSMTEQELDTVVREVEAYDLDVEREGEERLDVNHAALNKSRLAKTITRWRAPEWREELVACTLQTRPYDRLQDILFKRSSWLTQLQVLVNAEPQSEKTVGLKRESREVFLGFVTGAFGLEAVREIMLPFSSSRSHLVSLEPLLKGFNEERYQKFVCNSLLKSGMFACRTWRKIYFAFLKPPWIWFRALPFREHAGEDLSILVADAKTLRDRCSYCHDFEFTVPFLLFVDSVVGGVVRARGLLLEGSGSIPLSTDRLEASHGDLRQYIQPFLRGSRRCVSTIEEEGYLLGALREYGSVQKYVESNVAENFVSRNVRSRIENGVGRKKGLRLSYSERKKRLADFLASKRTIKGNYKKSRVTGWNIFQGEETHGVALQPAPFRQEVRDLGRRWQVQVSDVQKEEFEVIFLSVG
jgi:hypothetical protein